MTLVFFATPAPSDAATWVMMIAGFGAVGTAMRRTGPSIVRSAALLRLGDVGVLRPDHLHRAFAYVPLLG